jgi:predicted  nucleic acid-binding Zn-ribbon protein
METATSVLSSITDESTGNIETDYAALQSQITQQNLNISNEQTRITDMETNLQNELSQADAAIATLQSQKTYYADLFQAEYPSGASTA